jgi:hypothetical protein
LDYQQAHGLKTDRNGERQQYNHIGCSTKSNRTHRRNGCVAASLTGRPFPNSYQVALWDAYMRTSDAIGAAKPQTLEGMLAKTRATKLDARLADGREKKAVGTPAQRWAWDLMSDLLRLYGGLA